MIERGDPAITGLVQERARAHNIFADLKMSARISGDCNVAVDCNDRSNRMARASET
jgi:hypothetical protein